LRLWLGLGFVFYVYFVSTVAIRKAWATCTQSFAPWQQATIYSSSHGCHDHSIIAFLHHIYILLFFVHIPFVVNHTFNTTGEVATLPSLSLLHSCRALPYCYVTGGVW